MKINMRQWVADVIQQRKVTAIPVMTHPGIELNGNSVRDAVSNGKVHAEAVVRLAQQYPSVAACTIMDLTTEAEAFGADIAFSEDAVPAVSGCLLPNVESIYQLQVPSLSAGRIPAYLKANLLAAKAITDRPLFAGCIGPFSLAGRLYDMSEIMVLIYEHPDAAHTLLNKCTEFIEKYCLALKATGANGITQEKYITVSINKKCVEDARTYFAALSLYSITVEIQDNVRRPWWRLVLWPTILAISAIWKR